MEKLNLQVSYLIQFNSCFEGFPVINYTNVPALKLKCCVSLPYVVWLVLWFTGP